MGQALTDFFKSNQQGISLISTGIGGGMTAAGQIGSGFSASNDAAYQAAVFQNNALIANMNAEAALAKGRAEVQQSQVNTAQTIGAQKATLAAHGVTVNQDTGLQLSVDTARLGTIDQQTIQANADRQALAYKMQGINFGIQAKSAKAAGSDALLAGLAKGAGTLLGTGSSVAAKWLTYNNDYNSEDQPLGVAY